jgi:hypothetical protein
MTRDSSGSVSTKRVKTTDSSSERGIDSLIELWKVREARRELRPVLEPGAHEVSAAMLDCRTRFQLTAGQKVRFGREISAPLQAVVWNSLEDDVAAKKAMLFDILGVEIDEVERL